MPKNQGIQGSAPLPIGENAAQARTAPMPRLLANLLLSFLSILFVLAALEVASRVYYALAATKTSLPSAEELPPLHMLCDCPFLYRLNSEHPEISAQGLRDREYSIPKPPGVKRVLVLGDSITYGISVPAQAAFPNRLEDNLAGVEVINSGVMGYTAYNELQYYQNEGADFQADLVIVAFSMNDVVNPRRHINYAPEAIEVIPPEAIPNPDYDRSHVLPTIEAKKAVSPLDKSAVYQALSSRLGSSENVYAYQTEDGYSVVNGKKWPTFVTAEDTLSIQVLMDYQSREWQWLRGIYDQLQAAVEGGGNAGARMMILILPLSYQLDEDYPFLPQELMARYCAERSIDCLDLLPAFRAHRSEKLFLDASEGLYDIWHLTEAGHRLVAAELESYLNSSGFLSSHSTNE